MNRLSFNINTPGLSVEGELTLQAGRGIALLGDADSGNRLMLRAIAGLEAGTVELDGEPLSKPPQRQIPLCFSEPHLIGHHSVQDNLLLAANGQSPIEYAKLYALLGVEAALEESVRELTPLQAHAVALGRAILNNPRLLLLDRPNLEERERRAYYRLVAKLLPHLPFPLVFACHNSGEAALLAGHWLYLEKGDLKAQGSANELQSQASLPLWHDPLAALRIEGIIASHDKTNDVTHLDFRGGRLHLPLMGVRPGKHGAAIVPLNSLSLSLRIPQQYSQPNLIEVKVVAIDDQGPHQVLVRLETAGEPLLVRLSRRSVQQMGLSVGVIAYVMAERAEPAA